MAVLILYLEVVTVKDSSDDVEPALLQPVSTEIAVKLYGKDLTTLDRSNFNFNNMYEDFLHSLDKVLMAKTKLSLEIIEATNKFVRWKWYTIARSQAKAQPSFNAVETEEYYQQMQGDIQAIAEKNPIFRNMVICINIDIIREGMDDDTMISIPIGRVVIIFKFLANKVSNNSYHYSS
jgi:hypothetical protein